MIKNPSSIPLLFATKTRASIPNVNSTSLYHLSYRGLTTNKNNALYYYSNGLLNSLDSSSSSSNSQYQQRQSLSTTTLPVNRLQFTPNYRILSLKKHSSTLAASTTVSATANATASSSGQGSSSSPVASTTTVSGDGAPSVAVGSKSTLLQKVAKQAVVCHPPTEATDSHIPFEIKSKETNKLKESVLQSYLKGEKMALKKLTDPYITLTKPRLTFLIMLSSISSYALAPGATDITSFLYLTMGILLTSGSANAINMGREPGFDSQMQRTSTRPVVSGKVTPNEAFAFAGLTGTLGTGILYFGVNPIVASLGALNIALYSWIYTSLKRKSILNTWVGAVVGAIPPLMGWAACSSLSDPGAWCLAALLYAWQFPHFNTLSHNIKDEYKRAGYVMTAFVNPKLNARVALRYSILMFPICIGLAYYGVTDKYFIIDSSIFNGWLTYVTFQFWNQQRKNYSKATVAQGGPTKEAIALANVYAKRGFWGSVWQLPLVLVLAMLHKKGQWDRLFGYDEGTLQPV